MPRITDVTVDSGWAIEESMIDGSQLWVQETRFTLGNGYIGSRGILEEGHSNGYPGSYIAGVYDRVAGEPSEIVNLPNPVGVQVSVDGRTLSAEDMKVLDHRRVLDLRNAVLSRRTVFAAAGKRYEYESIRFFSLSNPHIGVMTFSLCSLDADAEITVTQAIDGTTRNEVQAVGQPVKHYTVSASEAGNGRSYLEATTNDPVVQVGMATVCMPRGARPGEGAAAAGDAGGQSAVQRVRFTARRGRRYRFDLFISTWTSRELGGPPRAACLSTLKTAIRSGASELVRRHRRAWEHRWAVSDIRIDGDRELQKAMRFNIYHLLIAAAPQDLDASVAAKALTGEWYKGHVFWDNEIYVLPFFTFTQPAVARNLLLYRSRRLPQARDKARAQGYAGSLWPWESAEDGRDETPDTWVNFDGTKIPVYNKTREHHIAADVAYGIISYWRATGDDDFLLRHGAEMVLETARFWASRATYNKQTCHYEIREVIGPNEFQESVDNNSYPELPISSCLGPSNAPSSTRAIVVSLTDAVNHPIKLTKPSLGVVS